MARTKRQRTKSIKKTRKNWITKKPQNFEAFLLNMYKFYPIK